MAVDIRAVVTCSAGELISGSTSDSYRAETGIIFQRGSCVVRGRRALSTGTPVSFTFRNSSRIGRVPRRLLVLGSSYNPSDNSTAIELGCDFTLLQTFRENKVYRADMGGIGDPSLDDEDAKIVTVPLLASNIATAILGKLGLGGSAALSNKFSVDEFDLRAGYVSVLSDLLQSENLVAWAGEGGTMRTANVTSVVGSGFLNESNIVDVQPLSIGTPPAKNNSVTYSTLKLKEPDDAKKIESLNWERDESYGVVTQVTVENPIKPGVGGTTEWQIPASFKYTYTPYTLVETTYDSLNRVAKRVTTENSIVAAIAPGYVQHISGRSLSQSSGGIGEYVITQTTPPEGNVVLTTITTEVTSYKVPAPSEFKGSAYPEGYEIVDTVTTTVEEPLLKLTSSTNIYSSAGKLNQEFAYGISGARFLASRQIRKMETAIGAEGQQVTKVLTEEYLCQAYTQEGQQAIVEAIEVNGELVEFFTSGKAVEIFSNAAKSIKMLGTRYDIASGRELWLQQRPPQGKRTIAAWAKGGDPNNGWKTQSVGATESVSGTGFGSAGFSLPYAPDDQFIKIVADGSVSYKAIRSDAPTKARNYLRAQLSLRAGLRHGVNVKASAFAFNQPVGAGISVGFKGISVYGFAEGVSYTMSPEGVIVSVDVVPLGTGGG